MIDLDTVAAFITAMLSIVCTLNSEPDEPLFALGIIFAFGSALCLIMEYLQ